MTEYAHNHAPRCCCRAGRAPRFEPIDTCPLCPEHGELAQLSNSEPMQIAGIPIIVDPEMPADQIRIAQAEYPCCHQLAGRPPTEYCPTPEAHAVPNWLPAPNHHT